MGAVYFTYLSSYDGFKLCVVRKPDGVLPVISFLMLLVIGLAISRNVWN